MTLRTTSLLVLSLTALFIALPTTPLEAARQPELADDDSPLLKEMDILQDQLKSLRRNLKKPEENANSLKAIQEMERSAVACSRTVSNAPGVGLPKSSLCLLVPYCTLARFLPTLARLSVDS